MVSDQEPRYRLVDSNGNVVGSLFVNGDGNVAIQDETATETEFTPNGVATPSVETDAVRTETIGAGDYLYAGDFDGADADARLSNALSASSENTKINLESGVTYDADISVPFGVNLSGVTPGSPTVSSGTTWSFPNNTAKLSNVRMAGTIDVTASIIRLDSINQFGGGTITIDGGNCVLTRITSGDVTFASGTSGNVIDSSTNVTVTDNGSNTVGDVT
jgi:hypothetical protein